MKTFPKMKPGQPIIVLWRDACSVPGWIPKDDYEEWRKEPATITSVGMYLDHDKTNLHIVQSASAGGARLADVLEVPLSIIDQVRKLK